MKTIFDSCTPREEVLHGDLRQDMFAARLMDVMEGKADPIYQDAGRFFRNTFATDGLRTLVREVLGRLSGKEPNSSPFIRLETSFGGGKTHNLIALYHLAHARSEGLPNGIVPATWIPSSPWLTAGVVGSEMESADGISHGDVTTRTIWGELAYQLGVASGIGGPAGYAVIQKSDEMLAAPGMQFLDKLIGDKPALILLDEIARYFRAAKAVPTTNGKSDLAEQTVAFLMTLIEFAASKEKVAVVLTLADSKDAFGKETEDLKQELVEAKRVSARQERVITPTAETEICQIVNHRLFDRIDGAAASETAQAYREYFQQLQAQGTDLPQQALRPEYAEEMAQSYPFHPELLNTLNRKTSTIPNFQRTRGALRLLARVVRNLWNAKPKESWLICVHDLDLGVAEIADDLTSRLDRPVFKQVIEADIVTPQKGSISHCQAVDRRWTESGKPPYARRTAINVLLHSLSQGIATGCEPAELMLSVLQPGDDPQSIRKSISLMLAEEKAESGTACWFLHWDGLRYRFKTEPSLEKVIQDEFGMVGPSKAKMELDERVKNVWKSGVLRLVLFPSEGAELDDDAKEPKLAVLHYDAAATCADAETPPELVAKLFSYAGSSDSYRTYKNNVLFLVADKDQAERMVDVVQRYLAICRIVMDTNRLQEFSTEQRQKLKAMQESAELEVRVAITRCYRHLYYPSSDAPKKTNGIAHEQLPAQDQGEVKKDQTGVVLKVLKQLQKALTADDPPMAAAYVKSKAWPHGQQTLSTEDLRKEFAKRIGLKILLDLNQLRKTIKSGTSQGDWVYYDAQEQMGYGKPSPAPMITFSEDMMLYLPEEAKRVGIKIKGEACAKCGKSPCVCDQTCPLCGKSPCECETPQACPTCGKPPEECTCGVCPKCGKQPCACKQPLLKLRVEGAPGQVFQKIADQFQEAGKRQIAWMTIRCEGVGKEATNDARSMGLAIPQLGKGNYRIDHTMVAEMGTGPDGDKFSVSFAGSWDRYKRLKGVTDSFGQEATKVNVKTHLRATFEEGLDVGSDRYGSIRDIFTTLGLGKLIVEVEEKAE